MELPSWFSDLENCRSTIYSGCCFQVLAPNFKSHCAKWRRRHWVLTGYHSTEVPKRAVESASALFIKSTASDMIRMYSLVLSLSLALWLSLLSYYQSYILFELCTFRLGVNTLFLPTSQSRIIMRTIKSMYELTFIEVGSLTRSIVPTIASVRLKWLNNNFPRNWNGSKTHSIGDPFHLFPPRSSRRILSKLFSCRNNRTSFTVRNYEYLLSNSNCRTVTVRAVLSVWSQNCFWWGGNFI